MKRSTWNALLLPLFFAAHAFAAPMALTFHKVDVPSAPVLRVESYEMKEGPNQELRIHLNPADAKALQELTAKNIGQTIIVKQGDKVLASPTIRAAITGQDFVVSLKK